MKINKKKYGFTLIELLAVIIILAVIALIAVPQILKILTNVRKHAAEDSALGYINAIETKAATSIILEEKEYENKEDYVYDEIEVVVSGKAPTAGIYSLQDNIITNGVFCINGYTVNYDGERAVATTKCRAEDLKLTGKVELSKNYDTLTYPEEKTVEISSISGGKLSCEVEDSEVATCSISGTTMTVTAGVKKGSTTITVTSAATSKYNEAASAYVATTEEGLLSYTANDYTRVYDGEEHGITVRCDGAEIRYRETESGEYNLPTSPKYINAGEYTVYYAIAFKKHK